MAQMTVTPVSTQGFFLDGKWIEEGDIVEIKAPYDGNVIANVFQGRREHAEAAIKAAVKAFGTTRRLPAFERQRVLRRVAQTISERKQEFSRTLAQEAGKPIKAARTEVERAVFTRAEIDKNNPEVVVGLFDLLRVFQEILARHNEEVLLEIEREEVTMAEMIDRLRNMVRSAGELNLMKFFERAQSRRELVVAFLSVLELVRLSEISLQQRETFGEITAQAVSPASRDELRRPARGRALTDLGPDCQAGRRGGTGGRAEPG